MTLDILFGHLPQCRVIVRQSYQMFSALVFVSEVGRSVAYDKSVELVVMRQDW